MIIDLQMLEQHKFFQVNEEFYLSIFYEDYSKKLLSNREHHDILLKQDDLLLFLSGADCASAHFTNPVLQLNFIQLSTCRLLTGQFILGDVSFYIRPIA